MQGLSGRGKFSPMKITSWKISLIYEKNVNCGVKLKSFQECAMMNEIVEAEETEKPDGFVRKWQKNREVKIDEGKTEREAVENTIFCGSLSGSIFMLGRGSVRGGAGF